MSFDDIPHDVLEHIAFFTAIDPLLGPPTGLLNFVSLSKRTYDTLAFNKNPLLYARICAAKFDLDAPVRRLGKNALTASALANEFVKRCIVLKRLRSHALVHEVNPTFEDEQTLNETLWTAYLMVLEDGGRNVSQLRNACISDWLTAYWFDEAGSSGAVHSLQIDEWPASGLGASVNSLGWYRCRPHLTLAMWLFWFFFDPAAVIAKPDLFRKAERLLKLVALNAPVYPLAQIPWTSFDARPSHIHFGTENVRSDQPIDPYDHIASLARSKAQAAVVKHFGVEFKSIASPPGSSAAILAYLALTAKARRDAHEQSIFGFGDGIHILDAFVNRYTYGLEGDSYLAFQKEKEKRRLESATSTRWDCEWERCIEEESGLSEGLSVRAFNPGSIDGAWEGSFTYTEFHSFAALLAGAKPSKIRDCSVAEHNQTWRLREYHLLAPIANSDAEDTANATAEAGITLSTLPPGEPLLAHVPTHVPLSEEDGILTFPLPLSSQTPNGAASSSSHLPPIPYVRYNNGDHVNESDEERRAYRTRLRDVLLTGEGHSGWGEFRLVGRVRPCDGFVSILKEYNGGDRGRWLYRGFVIGGGDAPLPGHPAGEDGYIAGRWRDTLTPAETHGYEGAFALRRRR